MMNHQQIEKMQRKEYETPKICMIPLEGKDVLTTSGETNGIGVEWRWVDDVYFWD